MTPATAKLTARATGKEPELSFKQRAHYLEKQFLRPLLRSVGKILPGTGNRKPPADLQRRLELLEARISELEQVVQEDLGLRLSPAEPIHEPKV